MEIQKIFARREIKFLLTPDQRSRVLSAMEGRMAPDAFGKSTICSLYLDTPDYLLIRRSLEHPLYKEKLRLRSYGTQAPDGRVFAEIKKKYKGTVYKRRVALRAADAEEFPKRWIPGTDPNSREIAFAAGRYPNLAPRMMIISEREAYYASDDRDFRVTFDTDIRWRDTELSLMAGLWGNPLTGPDRILMEIKAGGAIPLWMCRVLSENQLYKTSYSKYGNAFAAISGKHTKENQNAKSLQRTL